MTVTLDGLLKQGGFFNAFIFHVAGYPWAATNSPELKAYLDANPTSTIIKKIFGVRDPSGSYAPLHWDIVTILDHDLGSQSISYSEDKALDVGAWSVRLRVPDNPGFVFRNGLSSWDHSGLLGVSYQPDFGATNAAWSVLSADVNVSSVSDTVTIAWPINKDFGLKAYIDAQLGTETNLWCSCGAFTSTATVGSSGDNYTLSAKTDAYNSPRCGIRASLDSQHVYITNYPQAICGNTAYLYGFYVDSTGTVISGTTPHILRTGKVLSHATDNGDGSWTINAGGFTDQLKLKIPRQRFSAHISGYNLNTNNDSSGEIQNGYKIHCPHMIVVERFAVNLTDSITENFALVDMSMGANGCKTYDTISEIMEAAVTALNAHADLDFTYLIEGDDIVWSPDDTYAIKNVYMSGIVPFVCGVGYLSDYTTVGSTNGESKNNVESILKDLCTNQWMGTPFWPSRETLTADDIDFNGPKFVDLAESGSSLGLYTFGRVRNRFTCAYFMQFDFAQVTDTLDGGLPLFMISTEHAKPVPENEAGNRRIYYTSSGEVAIASGDDIQFGLPFEPFPVTPTAQTDTVTTTYFTTSANDILGMPWAMWWADGMIQSLTVDSDYRTAMADKLANSPVPVDLQSLLGDLNLNDPFEIMDTTVIRAKNPVHIFRAMLGDTTGPTGGLPDCGFPDSIAVTTCDNMVTRGQYNERLMVDWSMLQNLIDEERVEGVDFRFTMSDDDDRFIEADILSMVASICVLHSIRMVWEYNPSINAWWITFEPEGTTTYSSAVLKAREVSGANLIPGTVRGRIGGDWYYSAIKAEYQREDGETETFNIRPGDGRIQHSLNGRTFNLEDSLTVLPSDSTASREEIIARLSVWLERWCTVQHANEASYTLAVLQKIAVGGGMIADGTSILNRLTGRRDDDKLYCDVRGMTVNLGTEPNVSVQFVVDGNQRVGISPSMYVPTVSQDGTTLTCSGIVTSASNNNFADPNGGLTDLQLFDCVVYNKAAAAVEARDCTCGDYAVTIFERTTDTLIWDASYADANQNVWRGTIGTINAGAGTCVIELDDDNNFAAVKAANGAFVVMFAQRSHSDLQPCQIELYGWLGDENGIVTDSASATHKAITAR